MSRTIKDLKRELRSKVTSAVYVEIGTLKVATSKTALLRDIKASALPDATLVQFRRGLGWYDNKGQLRKPLYLTHIGA